MIFKNTKLQKTISVLILIGLVWSPVLIAPKRAHAFLGIGDIVSDIFVGINTGLSKAVDLFQKALEQKKWWAQVLNEIAKVIATRILVKMTQDTINWINSGFHGLPLFVENPDSFFNDIAKMEIKNLISTIGYDPIRFPFGRGQALNIINSYNSQLATNAAYSLSYLSNDPALLYNYRTNFSLGGWNGFLLHTQYPNNNWIGSRIQTTNYLALQLDKTFSTPAEKVRDVLQQGQGFLSPQTCPSNPNYPTATNPYNPPTFKFNPPDIDVPDVADFLGGEHQDPQAAYEDAYNQYEAELDVARKAQKVQWDNKYGCPGGLVDTTPGSIVASKIIGAVNEGERNAQLRSVLGGSLTAIFDALLSKLLNEGLSTLASKVNPAPQAGDDWDYFGNTLGSPATYQGYNDPFNVSDEELILNGFKTLLEGRTVVTDAAGIITSETIGNGSDGRYRPGRTPPAGEYFPGDIARTEAELALLDNPASTDKLSSEFGNYGVIQFLSALWPKVRELDICQPGPNYGWEQRLEDEATRASRKISKETTNDNAQKAQNANSIIKELNFAVSFFKDWIRTQMMRALPSSISFIDAINETETFDQRILEITDLKRLRTQTLARLETIAGALVTFTTQPDPGTAAEKELIAIRKQYNAIRSSIPNSTTLEDAKVELEFFRDRQKNFQNMLNTCIAQRQASPDRWNIPAPDASGSSWNDADGNKSIKGSAVGKSFTGWRFNVRQVFSDSFKFGTWTTSGREKEQFCELPIANGYTHDMFINNKPPPEYDNKLPLVNTRVITPKIKENITLSCNTIYRSYATDYKGNIPGEIKFLEPPPPPNDTEELDPNDPTVTPPPPPSGPGGGTPQGPGGGQPVL